MPSSSDAKQHAHELIDRMAPGQVAAVVSLLEIMLDSLAHTLASAPPTMSRSAMKKLARPRHAKHRSLAAKVFRMKKF